MRSRRIGLRLGAVLLAMVFIVGCRIPDAPPPVKSIAPAGRSESATPTAEASPPVHAFFLEVAGSMRYVMDGRIPGLETPSTMTDENRRIAAARTRLEIAKGEIIRRLRALPRDQPFWLVAYDGKLRPFNTQPVLPTSEHLQLAKAWLDSEAVRPRTVGEVALLLELIREERDRYARVTLVWDGPGPTKPLPPLPPRGEVPPIDTIGIDPQILGRERSAELERTNEWLRQLSLRSGGLHHVLEIEAE